VDHGRLKDNGSERKLTERAMKNGDVGENGWGKFGDRREGDFKLDGDNIDEGKNNDEGENIADVSDWTGEGKATEGCEPGLKDEAKGVSAWMDTGDKSPGGLIISDVLLFGIFSSNSLRRSTFTEQSPILRETFSPWGSTMPSFGLNFADT
jgi:hypothetical protein